MAALHPLANDDNQQGTERGHQKMRRGQLPSHPSFKRLIADRHFPGNPAEQTGAANNNDRIALHQFQYQLARPDNQRNANDQTKTKQINIVLGCGGDANYVATVTVQTVKADEKTYMADSEMILKGFQILPPK